MRASFPPLSALLVCACLLSFSQSHAQRENSDESKVGPYALPELLLTHKGRAVSSVRQWERVRRPEILADYAEHVYGRMPGRPPGMHYTVTSSDDHALEGKATRKEVVIHFTEGEKGPSLHLLIWRPNNRVPAPVFLGLNFMGNHSTDADGEITVTDTWLKANPGKAVERGAQATRWQVEMLIDHGYGLATAWYQDLEPDNRDGWKTGIRSTLRGELGIEPEEWSALGVWGWALSRITDYLLTENWVDQRGIIATGHSRLGKAALWGAANDKRLSMVVSNNSGEGGAALARRNFGETVRRINTSFPHWFIARFKDYNEAVDRLPVDQHMLLALMAPRPLYVASAEEDAWADPKGEYLSAWHAGTVYALYGRKGLPSENPPPVNSPVGETVRYHIRTGKHDVTAFDWARYIEWADMHLR